MAPFSLLRMADKQQSGPCGFFSEIVPLLLPSRMGCPRPLLYGRTHDHSDLLSKSDRE